MIVYILKTCRIASASLRQARVADKTLQLAQSGPDIRAVEPPAVVLESDWRHGKEGEGNKLWLYVTFVFTNTGSAPGVVSDLKLNLQPTLRDDTSPTWETDWPGPNDPVEHPEREPDPIEVPPHGSAARRARLYVRDYLPEHPKAPASRVGAGVVRLRLEAFVGGEWVDMKWRWIGNVSTDDADALRSGKGAGPGPPQCRIGRDIAAGTG